MKKPVFRHCNTIYTISWILTIPLLINICTGCNLFSFWVSWILFALIVIISAIRLAFGFRQKCYGFSWGLIAQLLLGAAVLGFFQLSFNDVIQSPVSHPVTPAELVIQPPRIVEPDSSRHSTDSISGKDAAVRGKVTSGKTDHGHDDTTKNKNFAN